MKKLLSAYGKEIFIIFLLLVAYFVLRLPNLTLQPIFADEAIYIRWAQVMKAEPTLRFVSLSDGKTPLFMWIMMPAFKIFSDPLFAGRILSVFAGMGTLIGVYLLSRRIFNLKTAFWAGLVYVIVPYTVFFDRMALVDSMLAMFTIWSIFFAVLLVQTLRLDVAMILGYLLGAALLVKTPAMLSLLMLPISVIGLKKDKSGRYPLIKICLLLVVSLIIALGIYNLLRLGPGFQQLSSRNADYIFSVEELRGRPLDPFIPHFNDIYEWFPLLLTWPVIVTFFIGIFFIFKLRNRLAAMVLIWALVPLMIEMAFLKTFTARYLLFSIPPILVISGYGVSQILDKIKLQKAIKTIIALLILLSLPLYSDYLLVTNPSLAPLPNAERSGYLEQWTAGYGFPEIAKYLIEQKKNGSVVVGTEGFFGTLPDGLQIYLDKAEIPIVGSPATVSAQIREAADKHQTFFVGNKTRLTGNVKDVELIMEFPKAIPRDGTPQDAVVLYKVLKETK